jgi:hypothetical protein
MDYPKVKIPYTNERVFPGGQYGYFEEASTKSSTQRIKRRRNRQVYSREFREWMEKTCGPATLGLYKQTYYFVKKGRIVDETVASVSSLKQRAIGVEFEFANPKHAVLFKLTWA